MSRKELQDLESVILRLGHGSPTTYRVGCRCLVCRSGEAKRQREVRRKKGIPARNFGRMSELAQRELAFIETEPEFFFNVS